MNTQISDQFASGELTTRPKRGRPAGLSAASRERLLNAAEDLFGRKGIDGVSLREIGEAAGQRNNNVVRYHFQTKSNLLAALLAERLGEVERMRQSLAGQHSPLSAQSPETLLRILWEPLLEVGNRQNRHQFMRLLLACQIERHNNVHPLVAAPEGYPASHAIIAALHGCFRQVTFDQFMYRLNVLAMMFRAAVVAHDEPAGDAKSSWPSDFSVEELIRLSVTALTAPAS